MKRIGNLELILDKLPDWEPTHIAFITNLTWSDSNLKIAFLSQTRVRKSGEGWPNFSKEFSEISMTFLGVERLSLSFAGSNFHQIAGFNINDISSYQWENLNFEIEDYEDSTISFYCKDIIVNSIATPRLYFFE